MKLILLVASLAGAQTLPYDAQDRTLSENAEYLSQEIRKTNLNLPKTNRSNIWTESQVFLGQVTFAIPPTQSAVITSTAVQIFVSTISGLTGSGLFLSSPTTVNSYLNVSSNVNVTAGVFMSYGVPGVVRSCSAAQVLNGVTISSGIVTAGTCGPPAAVLTYYSSVTVQSSLGLVYQASNQYSLIITSGTRTVLEVTKYGTINSTTQAAARWTRTSALTVSSNTNTLVTLPNKEYDTQGLFAITHATIPVGMDGLYSIRAFASFSNGAILGRRNLTVLKNGAGVVGCSDVKWPGLSDEVRVNVGCTPHLIAGDAISISVFYSEDLGINVNSASLEIVKLW